MKVVAIRRFPVKGLSGEALAEARLEAGLGIPGDRALGLKLAGEPPGWREKHAFLQLCNTPALARLRIRCDPAEGRLHVFDGGGLVLDAAGPGAAAEVEAWFSDFAAAGGGPFRALRLERDRFPDVPGQHLSLISRAAVAEVMRLAGRAVSEDRFRMNVVLDGPEPGPFPEWELVGRTWALGEARIRVHGRLPRCAAPGVDPETGARDLDVCGLLERAHGHHDLGVLATVEASGAFRVGDVLTPL